mgnify:FL=1
MLIIVLLNYRGFGCINGLQQACGGEPFNNLWKDVGTATSGMPDIDFAGHARSLGSETMEVSTIGELEEALEKARGCDRTVTIVLETDPDATTEPGGAWWDVAIPEVSESQQVNSAHDDYVGAKEKQSR